MTLDYFLRASVSNWGVTRKVTEFFERKRILPNFLSLVSFFFAVLAGFFFFLSSILFFRHSFNFLLMLAGIFVCANAFLDALDGILARESRKTSKKGDFLDHTLDRYSDVFIICGIFFGGYVMWEIGVIAIIGVLLSSYIGTQAEAVGLRRVYGGILGRADRLLIIIVATFLNLFYPYPVPSKEIRFTFLGWAMLILAFLSHVTALQRFFYMWKEL